VSSTILTSRMITSLKISLICKVRPAADSAPTRQSRGLGGFLPPAGRLLGQRLGQVSCYPRVTWLPEAEWALAPSRPRAAIL
jgi:hypothetical protein